MSRKKVDEITNNIAEIFKYIKGKDVFEMHYKKLLARRLIYKKSLNDEYELSLVSKFKSECGFQYTKKIDSMLKDFRLSLEID